ncbi:MAG: hypothetical protein FJX34_01850 [Alphaproteobacteria bacterium]|nr:hypothetical protein [Alphaproteobacteria bacterium]
MPKQLEIVEQRLNQVYASWNQLSEEKKRQKINLILPFIQITSYLTALAAAPRLNFILDDFASQYSQFYGQDLRRMESSDLSRELMNRLTARDINDVTKTELLGYEKKYIHAHNRMLFNYGRFLDRISKGLTGEKRDEIATKIAEILGSDDAEEVATGLVVINNSLELEKNSPMLTKDDLENHALLNQMSNYLQNIAHIPALLLDEGKSKAVIASMQSDSTNLRVKRDTVLSHDFTALSASLKSCDLVMQVGIETEFLLHPLTSNDVEPTSSNHHKNAVLKKVLADLNARRKMQTKYGLEPTVSAVGDMNDFFGEGEVTSTGAEEKSLICRRDFLLITRDIAARKPDLDPTKIQQLVASFTEAETFFYNLFFLDNVPDQMNICMDDIYDPTKTKDENFSNVWRLMEKGMFHSHLLDMIQVHEVSFGPYDFSETITKKREALDQMRQVANQTECSLDNPNVQLNLSLCFQGKNVLQPIITRDGEHTKIEISQLGVEFIRLLQGTVVQAREIQGLLRNQTEISAALDRKKFIGEMLQGTEYLDINPKLPAFLNHKRLAAKNQTIRVSAINDEVAVAEVRLVGNNPHFAVFDEAQNVFQSGLEFIPEALLPKIAEKMQEFLASKTKEEIESLSKQMVLVRSDGTIVGADPHVISGAINRDDIFARPSTVVHKPTAPRDASALIPNPTQNCFLNV